VGSLERVVWKRCNFVVRSLALDLDFKINTGSVNSKHPESTRVDLISP
jgi:hypothetical protein